MRHFICRAILSAAVILVVGSKGVCEASPDNPKAADEQTAPTIVGTWLATSVSIVSQDGERKPLSGGSPVNVIVSEKTFTMRVGEKTVAEMPYTLDPAKDPGTLELKTPRGPLSGIYRFTGNRLRIRLGDASQGLPRDFSRKSRGLDLMLRRMEGVSLFLINADGSNLHRLSVTPDLAEWRCPTWSSDGSRIAIEAVRALADDGESRIVVIDVASGAHKDLGPGANPSWSPDGKRIAFTADNDIHIVNAAGADLQQVDCSNGNPEL